jgi:hypothetical protein
MSTTAPITPGLVYRDEDHSYHLHGERIPSVTTIIQQAGMIEGDEFFTQDSRERGSSVHEIMHACHEGLPFSIANELAGYVLSADLFWQETRATLTFSETPLAHQMLKFAGTPDLPVVLLAGEWVVIDYKSGAYQPAHAVQVAAYVQLVRSNAEFLGLRGDEIPKRGVVLALQKDGSRARLHDPRKEKHPIIQAEAWAYFQSALNIYRYKETYHRGNN